MSGAEETGNDFPIHSVCLPPEVSPNAHPTSQVWHTREEQETLLQAVSSIHP